MFAKYPILAWLDRSIKTQTIKRLQVGSYLSGGWRPNLFSVEHTLQVSIVRTSYILYRTVKFLHFIRYSSVFKGNRQILKGLKPAAIQNGPINKRHATDAFIDWP